MCCCCYVQEKARELEELFLSKVRSVLLAYHRRFIERELRLNGRACIDPIANRIRIETTFRKALKTDLELGRVRQLVLQDMRQHSGHDGLSHISINNFLDKFNQQTQTAEHEAAAADAKQAVKEQDDKKLTSASTTATHKSHSLPAITPTTLITSAHSPSRSLTHSHQKSISSRDDFTHASHTASHARAVHFVSPLTVPASLLSRLNAMHHVTLTSENSESVSNTTQHAVRFAIPQHSHSDVSDTTTVHTHSVNQSKSASRSLSLMLQLSSDADADDSATGEHKRSHSAATMAWDKLLQQQRLLKQHEEDRKQGKEKRSKERAVTKFITILCSRNRLPYHSSRMLIRLFVVPAVCCSPCVVRCVAGVAFFES